MKSKKLIVGIFIVVALAQLFVPWQMISKQAGFANSGTEFKFKTDARYRFGRNQTGASLAGKFIWLHFMEDHISISDKKEWNQVQKAFVLLTSDSAGFAKIAAVTKTKPVFNNDWIRANIWIDWPDSTSLQLNFPFQEFYIEDTNQKGVDSLIKYGLNDSLKVSYLKIRIKSNQYIVNDLFINGTPFKESLGKIKN